MALAPTLVVPIFITISGFIINYLMGRKGESPASAGLKSSTRGWSALL